MHPITQNQDSTKLDIAADSMCLPCFVIVIGPKGDPSLPDLLIRDHKQLNLMALVLDDWP
jgi:hypothetical protein